MTVIHRHTFIKKVATVMVAMATSPTFLIV